MDTLILHSTPKEDLKNLIAETIKEQLATYFDKKAPDTRLRTRKEVCSMLGISMPTLHTWTKEGIISAYRIGSSVRYRVEDVESALQNIQSIKYNRYNNGRV